MSSKIVLKSKPYFMEDRINGKSEQNLNNIVTKTEIPTIDFSNTLSKLIKKH